MNITVSMVECAPFLARREQPTLIFDDSLPAERQSEFGQSKAARPGQWVVINSAHHPEQLLTTNIVELGETRIRIPLFSYNVNGRSFESIIGTTFHLALSIAARFQWHDVDHIHVAVGSVFETQDKSDNPGYQLWTGLAFHHKKEVN